MSQRLFIFTCFFTICLYAQQPGSPYSYYGIGDINTGSTVSADIMQGLSVYIDSLEVSLSNPASYGSLKKVNFSMGTTYSNVNVVESRSKGSYNQFALSHLSFGIPVSKKMAFGFGLMPYSTVKYSLLSYPKSSISEKVIKADTGSGGINRIYLSLGYAITRNISFGMSAKYNFGVIETSSLMAYKGIQNSSINVHTSSITGVSYDLALKYQLKVSNNYRLVTTLVYTPTSKFSSSNKAETVGVEIFFPGTSLDFEVRRKDLESLGLSKTTITLPSQMTFGLGFGKQNKWFLGAEYRFLGYNEFSSVFLQRKEASYKNAGTYALGGYYIPEYNAFNNYLKRIVYRAGVSFGSSGKVIKNVEINHFSASIGVGLPIKNLGNLNLGFEYKEVGSSLGNVIKEELFNAKVGFSFNDVWFIKRKYN